MITDATIIILLLLKILLELFNLRIKINIILFNDHRCHYYYIIDTVRFKNVVILYKYHCVNLYESEP